jgi:AbiU2
MATPLPLDERLNTATQLIIRARVFFDIWWFYEGNETRPIIKSTWENFDQFCIFDRHANLIAYVVQIASVFDRNRKTISLARIMEGLESSTAIPAQTLSELKSSLKEAEDICDRVKKLRHNLFAHRSASLPYSEVFKDAQLTANEMRKLTEISLQIANRLLSIRGLPEQFFNEWPRKDLERMFERLGKPLAEDT